MERFDGLKVAVLVLLPNVCHKDKGEVIGRALV